MDANKIIDDIYQETLRRISMKVDLLNQMEGVSAYIENGAIKVKFTNKEIADNSQNVVSIFIKGGAILTKEGQEKIKNREKITDKDFYFVDPIGEKL